MSSNEFPEDEWQSNQALTAPQKSTFDWPPILPAEVAVNESCKGGKLYTDEELCEQCGVSLEHYNKIKNTATFRAAVRKALLEVNENGGAVPRKSESQLEHWVDNYIPQLMMDHDASHSDKLKGLQILKDLSGISDKIKLKAVQAQEEAKQLNAPQSTPSLTIVLQTGEKEPEAKIIDAEPEQITVQH